MARLPKTAFAIPLALAFAGAPAAEAGTVYVPLPGVTTVGPVTYETQVLMTNGLTEQRTVKHFQIATGVDGTKRSGTPTSQAVGAGRTVVLKPTASSRGLLEISGPLELQYSARLVGTGNAAGLGIELPMISSDTMAPANDTLVVQGLDSGGTKKVDFVIVNLSKTAATCTLKTLLADGTPAFGAATVTVLPLSHRFFPDVFATGGAGDVVDARVAGSCTGEFFLYAQLIDSATGEFAVAGPSASGRSTLVVPGEEPSPTECSTGTVCYVFPGLVHQSTLAVPDRSITLTPPAASYSSVMVHLEVQINGGFHPPSTGAHGLLYFIQNRNKDMFANVFLRGPNKNLFVLRHGFNLTHGEKPKLEKGLVAQIGETYVLDYEYNPAAQKLVLQLSKGGQLVALLQDEPNISRINIAAGDKVIVGLSNSGVVPDVEPASIGWRYSNLKVEFFP